MGVVPVHPLCEAERCVLAGARGRLDAELRAVLLSDFRGEPGLPAALGCWRCPGPVLGGGGYASDRRAVAGLVRVSRQADTPGVLFWHWELPFFSCRGLGRARPRGPAF